MTTKRGKGAPERELSFPALSRFAGGGLETHGDYDAIEFVDLDLSGQDGTDASFLECRFHRCRLDGTSMRRARITESLLRDLHGASVDFTDSAWRDSHITGGRLGALTLVGAAWTGIRVRGSHLGFVNLAGAHLDDVVFDGCEIDGLDARTAELQSVAFIDCRLDELNVAGATLSRVDLSGARLRTIVGVESLRGAVVSHEQLMDLLPLLAAQVGLEVREAGPG